jgi:glc operon protein GlcG
MKEPEMTPEDKRPAPPAPPPPYGPPLPLALARRVMAAAEAEANANGWPVVIAIVDSSAHLVMLHRLDQANLGAVALAQRKAQTAIDFRRSTKVYEDLIGAGGLRLLSVSAELIALEGGVPLIAAGHVVGAIGVSGMQSFQDGQVADAGARALQTDSPAPQP